MEAIHLDAQDRRCAGFVEHHLILTIARPATVWFDLVSLFPPTYHARPGGIAPTS